MFRYILLVALLFSGLFGADTYYDQVIENDSWKDKAKVKLIDNRDDNGTFSISTTDSNSRINIARGYVDGSEPFGAYGKKVVSSATGVGLLWADDDWSIPATEGEILRIVSTDDEDGIGGDGIRSLVLHYLDADLEPQQEEVIMTGTTEVNTTATDIRFLQCAHVHTYGETRAAEGVISFTNLADTKKYNEIGVAEVRCSSTARMVPAGKRAVIVGLVGSSVSGTAAASSLISIAVTYFAGHDYTADAMLIPVGTVGIQDNAVTYNLPIPHIAPEGTIVAMTCETDKGSTMIGDWFGWLENAD